MRIRWREYELPNRVVQDESVSSGPYGMFVAEPFERGFAHTVGNGLRRVLLSSLEGAAVTHVRIQGVPHEFATIEGVVEDMTELSLNLKKVLVTCRAAEPRTIRHEAKKKGPATPAAFRGTQANKVLQIGEARLLQYCEELRIGHHRSVARIDDGCVGAGRHLVRRPGRPVIPVR